MNPIESFATPTLLSADDDSTAIATTDQATVDQASDESSVAEETDTFEQAPSLSTNSWSKGTQSLGDILGELRSRLGPAVTAFKSIDTAQTNTKQLDLGFGAIGKLAGPLSKLSSALGWTEGAAKIPQATNQLEEAWKAYQDEPSKLNAEKLKAALDAWRGAAEPLVEKVPIAPVAAQLAGMLEIATKTSGNMSVLFSDRSERATAASIDGSGTPREADKPLTDPQLAAKNAEIEDSVAREQAVPTFEEVPAEIDRKLEAWRCANGLRELPVAVQDSRERLLDLHSQLAAVREERSGCWNPSKRAALAAEEKELTRMLRATLGNLEAAASASAPDSGTFLNLGNVKQAF